MTLFVKIKVGPYNLLQPLLNTCLNKSKKTKNKKQKTKQKKKQMKGNNNNNNKKTKKQNKKLIINRVMLYGLSRTMFVRSFVFPFVCSIVRWFLR